MSLDIRPTLSALLRNRTGAVLVAAQVAIALAVLANATYIIVQRLETIHRPTGIDENNILVVESAGFTPRFNQTASVQEDLAYLRAAPGVIAATATNSIPLSNGGNNDSLVTRPGTARHGYINDIEVDEQGLDTLGVRLIAGRNFRHQEIQPALTRNDAAHFVPVIIVSRALGEYLFPQQNPLGKQVWDAFDHPATIIGVVDPVMGAFPASDHPERVFFLPRMPDEFIVVRYLVRTQPGERDTVARLIESHLASSNPDRVLNFVRPLSYFKNLSYLGDSSMELYLVTVTALVIAVTSLGVFALATFNVSTRTKQIGTRRAVGARRRDVVQYFMVENGLITSAGVLAGCGLALAAGYWLSVRYALPRLELYYLVGGVVLLWAIGQLAAWQPARRAASVQPSVATRSV
ncbi:MAG: FtsX-like permease family protein [Gammaproteobacteria bacterium]|nr:FtsX-like permease family protein [Gammaproteobacteria bacterium]MBV9725426.1 FtsX-like permease family protein [Gammaproteobacteria bacterium]